MSEARLAERLADEVAAIGRAELAPAVLERATELLRDYLGVALGPASHYRRGFHPTGTCGAFGAAAAAGLVLGLDAPRLADALGIAGSQAAGSMEFLANGAWTKRLHPGWAALAGLHAATLAGAGFRAPTTILEGRSGFLHAYSDGADPAALEGSGNYELLQTSVKPHACCRYMQGPIDGALALRASHHVDPPDVERIEVGMLAAGHPIVCEPLDAKRRPASVVDAQFSLPFGIAVALVCGSASPAEFAPPRLADPTVLRLAACVVGVRDSRLDAVFPREWPSWIRITLRDGRVHEAAVPRPRGDAGNFPTPAELDAKFRTLAARALPDVAVARLAAAVEAFGEAPSVAPLLAAAVPLAG